MRVLVVDDEANVRKLLRLVLTRHGYEVLEAENGLQGLQVAKQQRCDLVITDQIMPVLDGLDMISHLAAERYPARYLLISGYGVNQGMPPGLSLLRKPFSSSQLMDALERLQQEPTLLELERGWQVAKQEWEKSIRQTEEFLLDVPSQIPHPDGELRIERAALRGTATYERYMQAFHKYRRALKAYGVLGGTAETSEPRGGIE